MTDPQRVENMIAETAFETAEDLLDALSPQYGSRWNLASGGDDWDWIYRGQRDATWGLTPSALRPNVFEPFKPGWKGSPWVDGQDPYSQRSVEEIVALEFADVVDQQGLTVPGDRPELRDRILVQRRNDHTDFPPVMHRGIYALAQHHGIPTRLLDWSYDPRVACYFACESVARDHAHENAHPEKLAIWAISRSFIDDICRSWDPYIAAITVPTASNTNLHAQRGLFTVVGFPKSTRFADIRLPDLDTLLRDVDVSASVPQEERHRLPALYKYTLPSSQARALLRYLSIAGVSAASVFPNHGGAVRSLREKRWYQRLPPRRRGE